MQYDLIIARYSHDRKPSSHFHENYEIHLSLNNDGSFFVRDRCYPMQYGAAFLLGQFEFHHCFCSGKDEYDRYVIQFPRSALADMSSPGTDLLHLFDNAPLNIVFPEDSLNRTLILLDRLSQPLTGAFAEDLERKLAFEQLILITARLIRNAGALTTIEKKNSPRVDEILAYIHTHYQEDINLDAMSAQLYMSKSRMNQVFRETTDFSIGDYIITCRLQKACILLQKGVPVKEAGRMAGFSTPSHFIRMFNKRLGTSPGAFARIHQMKNGGK